MLTSCPNELPNPHKDCLRDVLNALVIQQNDFQRMNIELRGLQIEFKEEMRKLQFPCSQLRRMVCCRNYDQVQGETFIKRIGQINEVYNCFTRRIEDLSQKIREIMSNARNCLVALENQKMNLKRFHERTIDHLKRHIIKSRDPQVTANCEKDICEMHRLFVKEVAYIKRVEGTLQGFFDQIRDGDTRQYSQYDTLKRYEWLPGDKGLSSVDGIANAIKMQMGSTLVKAFAQVHLHQPTDVKGFMATYLLNLERNDKALQEKMQLLGHVETVVCEYIL